MSQSTKRRVHRGLLRAMKNDLVRGGEDRTTRAVSDYVHAMHGQTIKYEQAHEIAAEVLQIMRHRYTTKVTVSRVARDQS